MPYNIPQPYPIQPLNHLCIAHNVFTDEQMEQIDYLEELQNFEQGTVGPQKLSDKIPDNQAKRVDLNYRNSKIAWIYPDQNSIPFFNRFSEVLQQVNLDHFRRNIQGFDNMQYTIYEEGDFYDWHWDYEMLSGKYIRKISATIMVSGPEEYEGGEFEITNIGSCDPEKILSIKPQRGDVIFFASWMPHRVKPIIKGKRKSLVVWVMGEDNG
jgi:PKHD-type hydroxylase